MKKVLFLLVCVFALFALTACELDLPGLGLFGSDDTNENVDTGNDNQEHVHEYTWTIKQSVKCNVDGIELGTCSCGETTTRTITATGHEMVTDAAVEATCTTDGLTEGSHCEKCGHVEVAQEVVPAAHVEVVVAGTPATEENAVRRCRYG